MKIVRAKTIPPLTVADTKQGDVFTLNGEAYTCLGPGPSGERQVLRAETGKIRSPSKSINQPVDIYPEATLHLGDPA